MWKEQNNVVTQWRSWKTSQISATFETGLTSNVAQEQDCARFTSEKHSTDILRASNTKGFSWSYDFAADSISSPLLLADKEAGSGWKREAAVLKNHRRRKKGDAVDLYKQWQLLPTFVLLPWLFSHDWKRFSHKNKIKVTTKVLTVRKDFALLP